MEKIKTLSEKLKNNKIILIILIIGVGCLFVPSEKKEAVPEEGVYEREIRSATEKIIGEISGAGKVSVAMSFYDKGKSIPLTDKSENRESVNEKTVSQSGKVALFKEEYPSVRGGVVVCDGGDDEMVKGNIINAVSALTGAPIHNIKVFKMEG